MPELTPRDDIKKAVSEILKRVDQLLKAGELDAAMQQIAKAKATDPKNVYVFAYEERLDAMIEERRVAQEIEAKRKAEEEKRRQEEEARRREEDAKRKADEEKRRKEEERRRAEEEKRKEKEEREQQKAEEEESRRQKESRRKEEEQEREVQVRRKVEAERSRREKEEKAGHPERKVPEISREVLEETKLKILEDRKKKGIGPELGSLSKQTYRSTYDEGLDIYRKVLMEAWSDGATTSDEEEQLRSLRASFQIIMEDHGRLEREAKLESYTLAFKRAWASGAISPESASSLAELRKKFKINIEEHEEIETKLLWELRPASQKAQIMVIDDDEKLLRVIGETLQDAGFQTIAITTTDEAFRILKETTPDLIISDINLETSTMGGFSFYEKVREIERLHEIPFIFLSGLTDEVLIRTGKELGVDDYITKPFSDDSLIATIKGKLKRYRQLRKNRRE
ncbi:MAG: response regulator [Ignavibacteriales bacterium]|nr:response regulator [Ignavibacteriales bacterium]